MTTWKPIIGFEGLYMVSSDGEVVSLPRDYKYGKIENPTPLKKDMTRGYYRVTLFKDGVRYRKMVHLLVAKAFIENPEQKPIVNHKDENRTNNTVENLMWCTYKENSNWGNCRRKISEKVSKRVIQYTKDGMFIRAWKSATEASKTLGIDLPTISVSARDFNKTAGCYKWRYDNEKYQMA